MAAIAIHRTHHRTHHRTQHRTHRAQRHVSKASCNKHCAGCKEKPFQCQNCSKLNIKITLSLSQTSSQHARKPSHSQPLHPSSNFLSFLQISFSAKSRKSVKISTTRRTQQVLATCPKRLSPALLLLWVLSCNARPGEQCHFAISTKAL